eukprot:TRINITY_DN699_c0_g2_i1.p2 TRINITY_DN699_c0_g2~~TRINITY_DN699_c0_g2_i1.p2  ORF type:complete len:161 (-),score=36.50 TRINITY_DN699_c0_g2_i1:200-682(-)
MYAVRVSDLRSTGKPSELVVTNYKYSGRGALFVYVLDSGDPTKVGPPITLYDEFHNVQWMPGSGAPGFVFPHFARAAHAKGDLANIFVAGDGAEQAYLFEPTHAMVNGSKRYEYKLGDDINYMDTVGGMAVGDVDGDGMNEVFVSAYETGQVHVISYGRR